MAGLSNKHLAGVLKEIEILLKLTGESDQRAMNYGRLSRMIEGLEESAADLAAQGTLKDVKGLGPRVQTIVAELVDTGTSTMRDDLAGQLAPGVIEILRVPGLGPKRIHTVVNELGVSSIEELVEAASDGRLAGLKGFGQKTAANVLEGIDFLNRTRGRMHVSDATAFALEAIERLELEGAVLAGQLRRATTLVDAVAIVVAGDHDRVLLDEPRGAKPALRVRMVPDAEFARVLFLETGPAEHVEAVLARSGSDGSEEAIYSSRGLHLVPPERRHACDGSEPVPRLVEEDDVSGLVHAHTTWSDGTTDIAGMAAAAHERGYAYLTITDHSRTAVYARGLTVEQLMEQSSAVREFNARGGPVRVLHGIEADILPDGSMDYPDEVLAELDFVIASIHSSFTQEPEVVTERVLSAVRNQHVNILGHMTGRLLLRRGPYAVDVERVLEAAAESGTAIELNANPWRLDIDPEHHGRCVELGVSIPICPDAHSANGMDDVFWGVRAARHGGLRAQDVANCADADGFLEAIGRCA